MKSNFNSKLLKFCIVEICTQIGFERISEQSLNILSDLLKYYITQIFLKVHKLNGIKYNADYLYQLLINELLKKDSYQVKELFAFLQTQSRKENIFFLNLMKIPTNDLFGEQSKHVNELESETSVKTHFIVEKVKKDKNLEEFISKRIQAPQSTISFVEYKFEISNLLQDNILPKDILVDKTQFNQIRLKQSKAYEIFVNSLDIFQDLDTGQKFRTFEFYD